MIDLPILRDGSASFIVLFGLFYLMRGWSRKIAPDSASAGMLPTPFAGPANKVLSLLIHPDLADATPTNV